MTAPARVIENVTFTLTESEIVAVDTAILLEGIDAVKAHSFGGVQFFADAAGATPATPTSGTVDITIQTINNTPNFEAPPGMTIDVGNMMTVTWAANTQAVLATPDSIVGAAFYRLVVTNNET